MCLVVKFESNQDYQAEAIESIIDLFDGLPSFDSADHEIVDLASEDELFQESVFPNGFAIDDDGYSELVWANLEKVQSRTRQALDGSTIEIIPPDQRSTRVDDDPLTDFSVEMETGTGKTYVYLRTAIELYLKYGLSKFVIVVPSVAIREGVLSALRMTKDHFHELYAGVQMDHYAYDSKNLNRIRQFATSKHLQILVMNIAAFHKDGNIINREADGMNGRRPIDFIRAVRPVVIMDEPQKLGSSLQNEAIAGLNPLLRLRYSATHKDHHHRVYRLTPVDAYNMRLVKRIDVLSVVPPDAENSAFIEVKKITSSTKNVTATLVVNMPAGKKSKTVKMNDDLVDVTGLEMYRGWVVEDIVATSEERAGYVEFQNGRRLSVGDDTDTETDSWHRELIRATIEDHLGTELRLVQQSAVGVIEPIKPLTLFFIDKVANYFPDDGKFRVWFEEEYTSLVAERRFRSLDLPPASDVHRGYFATSKGQAKDSKEDRSTKDDDDAYDLIMKDKERLMSIEEPVRFIFSHSALAEGWDNPNVFTICNLQQTRSEVRRRQQIGRGLRLPVMANGERCRVDEVNHLTVVANEEFEKFASGLQKDIENETGFVFNVPIKDKRTRVAVQPKKGFEDIAGFRELWSHISPRTTYRLEFDTEKLVEEGIKRLRNAEPIQRPKYRLRKAGLGFEADRGIVAESAGERTRTVDIVFDLPDLLGEVTSEVPISRATVKRIIQGSGRLAQASLNPAQFRRQVVEAARHALAHTLKEHSGVVYSPRTDSDATWDMEFFVSHHAEAYEDTLVPVSKSIYDRVPVDSEVEKNFAKDLDARDDVLLFVKLPGWYKIDTPVGGYNPDWAIVRKEGEGTSLYLVRETKGSSNLDDLFREHEVWKVTFGRRHFDAIDVDYKVVKTASELDDDNPEVLQS